MGSTWDSAKKIKLHKFNSKMYIFSYFNISEIGMGLIIDHCCPGFFQRGFIFASAIFNLRHLPPPSLLPFTLVV